MMKGNKPKFSLWAENPQSTLATGQNQHAGLAPKHIDSSFQHRNKPRQCFVCRVKFLRIDKIQKYLLVCECAQSPSVAVTPLHNRKGNHMVTFNKGVSD